jgi:hypothetical protein
MEEKMFIFIHENNERLFYTIQHHANAEAF